MARVVPSDRGEPVLGTLRRQVLKELVATTLIGLVGVSFLMTIVMTMVEGLKHGINPFGVLALTPYLIPTLLPYTLPTCLLYACVSVFGGMSGANEVTALKAAGVHPLQILWPAALLAVAVSATTFVLTDRVIPACNRQLQEVLLSDIESAVLNFLKTNNYRLRGDRGEFEVNVRGIKGRKLIEPFIIKKNPNTGESEYNIKAEEATLWIERNADPKQPPLIKVRLVRPEVRIVKNESYRMSLKTDELPLPVPSHLWSNQEPKLETLTLEGCAQRAQDYCARSAAMETEYAWNGAVALINGRPDQPAAWLREHPGRHHQDEARRLLRKSRDAIGEMHIRGSHSSAALAFALLGCPISILLARRDTLQTFFLCFAPIVGVYYPSVILAFNVFKEGSTEFDFYLGQMLMWVPTVGLASSGLASLQRLFRT